MRIESQAKHNASFYKLLVIVDIVNDFSRQLRGFMMNDQKACAIRQVVDL